MIKRVTAGIMLLGTLGGFGQWAEWRGPHGSGWVAEGKLPKNFGGEGGYEWKVELPGRGCSTPIVHSGVLYVTAPVEDKDALLAYGLDGKEKWRQVFGKQKPGRGQRVGSGANSSPVTNGEVVVSYFKSGRVVGCSVEGKKLWEVGLHEKFGEDKLWWDQGTSPVLVDDSVVVAVMQTEGNSYLVSLDLKSGKVRWKTDRKYEVPKENGDSYTTPLVMEIEGVKTIVTFGADHVTGHDARSGKLLWTCGGLNPKGKAMWRVIASAVETKGVVVVPHGRGEWFMGIRPGGEGNVTGKSILWRKKMLGTDSATPVAKDGKVYVLTDSGKKRGTLTCLKAFTGEVLWEGKLPKSPSKYYASPILVGDSLCCVREDGVVFCVQVSDQGMGEVVENKIGEGMIASPIFVNGKLILRGDQYLWCFGN